MNTSLAYTPIDTLRNNHSDETAAQARTGLPHVQIGMNITVRATRERPERERKALRWLANYIHREKLSAEAICGRLDAHVTEVRLALTSADVDVRKLVSKIESLRAILDANLRVPADTAHFRDIQEAFDFAVEGGALVEYVDLTRTGKTVAADWLHLTNLDHAGYVDCTNAESYAAFIVCVAKGLGISVRDAYRGKGPERLEALIDATLGAEGFDTLIIDEGHYLWPTNIKLKPKRVEYVRKLHDRMKRKLAIFILSTPQTILSSNQALAKNKRWSPGQWEGRINRYFPSQEKVSDADIEKVARWHCPDGNASIIAQMVLHAKASPGFYGAMVNALERARFKAKRAGERFALEHLKAAQLAAIKGTTLGVAVAQKGKA